MDRFWSITNDSLCSLAVYQDTRLQHTLVSESLQSLIIAAIDCSRVIIVHLDEEGGAECFDRCLKAILEAKQ